MGWTFPNHTPTRKRLVDWLLEHQNEPGRYEIIDHSQRGNVLYTVFRNIAEDYRFIVVFLLEGPSVTSRYAGDFAWGYKDIDESMGPSVLGCPERLLRQSDTQSRNACAWREACRHERRVRAERRRLAKASQAGDRLRYSLGLTHGADVIASVTFVRHYSSTFFIGKDTEGRLWRYRWRFVVVDTLLTGRDCNAA